MSSKAHVPHILPLSLYLTIGATLLVLTAITVTVSQFDFGPYNLVIAMTIAAIKALLVAFFFMHLWFDSKVYFSIFAGALLFLAVFIVLIMFDTQRRGDIDTALEGPIEKSAAMYQQAPVNSTPGTGEQPKTGHDSSKTAPASVAHDSAK